MTALPLLTDLPSMTRVLAIDDAEAESAWSASDSALVALSLYAVWAARTGRTLRNVPVSELTREELEEFWADDQL